MPKSASHGKIPLLIPMVMMTRPTIRIQANLLTLMLIHLPAPIMIAAPPIPPNTINTTASV